MSPKSFTNRRRLGWASAAAVALAMVGLAAAPAAANAAVTHPTDNGVRTHTLLSGDTAAAGAAVDRFWTRARLKAAKSLDGTTAPVRLPTAAQMRAASAPVVRAANAPAVLPPSMGFAGVGVTSTVGRVFFSDSSGALDSCSGSSVTSQAGDMVLTAGHCVFGGPQFDNSGNQPRNWYYNWIYIPGYYVYNGLGFAPYGIWNAWEIASTAPWIGYADTSQDVGMALMVHNSSGYALTTIVGGQGLTWDLPVGQQVTDYGYPVNPSNPSAPAGLQSCSAPIYRYGGTGPYADITCAMAAPGASGGPWLAFQDAWGMGLVGGLNSFIWPGTNFVFSPWFSQYVYNMYASLATV